ncbi:hypothetical protein PGB90_004823 [Kerria lacca]
MLSDREKSCLKHFLNFVDDGKLKALASSVTMGRIQCNSREDAINTIILHSESIISFFNRKKVTAAMLFKYINYFNVSIPGDAPKEMLIRRIFEGWQLPYSHLGQSYPQNISNSCNSALAGNQTSLINSKPEQSTCNNPLAEAISSRKLLKEAYSMAYDEFALQFAGKYFELINQPTLNGTCYHSLNTSHFFNNCKLFVNIMGEEEIEVSGENVENVLQILSDLQEKHKLIFVPNLTPDGVRAKIESHGLIYAFACGTIDKAEGPVGVFEQSFIMRKDPCAQNSCKIMETALNLKSSNVVSSFSQLMLNTNKNVNNSLAIKNESNQLCLN